MQKMLEDGDLKRSARLGGGIQDSFKSPSEEVIVLLSDGRRLRGRLVTISVAGVVVLLNPEIYDFFLRKFIPYRWDGSPIASLRIPLSQVKEILHVKKEVSQK